MHFLGSVLLFFIRLYIILITVRILLSWLTLPYNRFTHYLGLAVDPVLHTFKRIFPLQIGFLDLSPLVPLLLLSFADSIITDIFIHNQAFGVAFLLSKIVFIIKYIFNIITSIFTFSAVIMLVMLFIKPHTYSPLITMMRSFLDPVMSRLRRILHIHSFHSDKIYLVIVIVLTTVISILGNGFFDFLMYRLIPQLRF